MGLHIAPTNLESTLGEGGLERIGMRGAETILVVEDEAFVREVTCEVLHSAGYQVLTARNAREASAEYASHSSAVNLLLTDVILPGETGPVLAARLRRDHPELRILFVTGYIEQMAKPNPEGADFLAKPFSAASLLAKVRQVLDGKAARGEATGAGQVRPGLSAQLRRAAGTV